MTCPHCDEPLAALVRDVPAVGLLLERCPDFRPFFVSLVSTPLLASVAREAFRDGKLERTTANVLREGGTR